MNIQKMMKQAQEMQHKIAELQQRQEAQDYEGAAGGGLVRMVVTGKGYLRTANVDASLLKAEEKEMLEDLIVAAFNDAKARTESAFADEMQKLTASMGLPANMKLPF